MGVVAESAPRKKYSLSTRFFGAPGI